MPHRRFRDATGAVWDVWDVHLDKFERRNTNAPQQETAAPSAERRRQREFRPTYTREWAEGWLVFESSSEKRRLTPVPDGWEQLPEGELITLLARAIPVMSRPRGP